MNKKTSQEEKQRLYKRYRRYRRTHRTVMSYFEKKYNDIDKVVDDNIDIMLLQVEREHRRFFIKRIICFKKFICEKNISIKKIAKICGVTNGAARNWIEGKNWPTQKNIMKIAIKTGFDYNMT